MDKVFKMVFKGPRAYFLKAACFLFRNKAPFLKVDYWPLTASSSAGVMMLSALVGLFPGGQLSLIFQR